MKYIKSMDTYLDPIYDDEGNEFQGYYDDEYTCFLNEVPAKSDTEAWDNVYLEVAQVAKARYEEFPDDEFDAEEAIKCVMQHVMFSANPGNVECPTDDMDPTYGGEFDKYIDRIYAKFLLMNELNEAKLNVINSKLFAA